MDTYSDEQLMASLIEEDNLDAFETILARYEKPLLLYIIRLIGDYQKAQDLYQETFYLIFKKRESFDPTLRFSPWAYRIATNLCFKELKKKTHKLEIFLEDINQGESASGGSIKKGIVNTPSNPSHEEKLIKRDLEDKVHDLIKSLPEKLLSVFILSTYQDLSHQEISKILDIPLGTVKSRLRKSFKQLHELIKKRGLINELQ
jgi:RNA polymerase sigma-70 factor (ECF subfamily)